jgi:hypothetical protein
MILPLPGRNILESFTIFACAKMLRQPHLRAAWQGKMPKRE